VFKVSNAVNTTSALPTPLSSPKLICNKFVDNVKLESPVIETVFTVEFNCSPVNETSLSTTTETEFIRNFYGIILFYGSQN